jgi:hypothetical protein
MAKANQSPTGLPEKGSEITPHMCLAHERLFSMFVTHVMSKVVPDEWTLVKYQFDALVFEESVYAASIEQTLDEQVRRRFVELINRAADRRRRSWI